MTDPRFDPAFQRGYSGPQPKPVARVAAPSPRAEVAEPEPAAAPAGNAPVGVPVIEPAPEPDPDRALLNPYRLALLLFGLALLFGSATLLFEQVQHPQGVNTTIEGQFVQMLTYNLPPGLALAGLVCLIVWLTLGALDRTAGSGKG